ncbi:MAG: sodium/proline symporter [Halioglobus sp.]|nr:sodium/proline symporter [Halioglobus sp.]
MDTTQIVLFTLLVYKLLLIGVGFWASRRTRDQGDFFIGGRGLGPVVAAISYSSSASSAWTLLGMSGLAYVVGVSALWLVVGSVLGMFVAWWWIAPRLMEHSRQHGQITLTDFILQGCEGGVRRALLWLCSLIIVTSFTLYVAAQFQGAGNTFASTFGLSMSSSIVTGALIIMVYTLLGGFWAVSVTDTIQGLLMAAAVLALPITALAAVGGWEGFITGLRAASTPQQLSLSAGNAGLLGLGVVLGGTAIGIGTFGQPHLLVRFMALRDRRALLQARWISLAWYLVVFGGMFFLGLVGHVLQAGIDNPENIFFVLTERLFPTALGAVILAAVLSAIMSTADSQLLVAASAIAHDLGLGRGNRARQMLASRLTIVALVLVAVLVAIYLPEKIFSRVLFAWVALGSAFGPLVFLRLAGCSLQPGAIFASVLTGFALAVVLAQSPLPMLVQRLLPFALAALVLWVGRVQPQDARRSVAPPPHSR